jgi:hypothetical protein
MLKVMSISEPENSTCSLGDVGALSDIDLLMAGMPQFPFNGVILPESTTGTLELGLTPAHILADTRNIVMAASSLGYGRIIAFSGQDFLGSQDRSTLLGTDSMDTLLRNSVTWLATQSQTDNIRILTDNNRITDVLRAGGLSNVETTTIYPFINRTSGTRNWSSDTLSEADIAIVQVNEWGTNRVRTEDIDGLRSFVQSGGGLIIAGSATHWDWWLRDLLESPFIGNLITQGSGIAWNTDVERELSALTYGNTLGPIWCEYITGETIAINDLQVRLPGLLKAAYSDGLYGELDIALERLISETPELPVSSEDPLANLSIDVATSFPPYDWPRAHPWASVFPGVPADDSAARGGTVSIDTQWATEQPLGFYAPPGKIVTISTSALPEIEGLKIQIGENYDNLIDLRQTHPEWRRSPTLLKQYPLNASDIQVSNPFGGAIYLVIPDPPEWSNNTWVGGGDRIQSLPDSIELAIDSAIPMAVFTAGESDIRTWAEDLGYGAPQAILQEHGGIRMVVSRERALAVSDPSAVMDYWSGFIAHHAELAQEPEARPFESHWIFDTQVGYGYANAGVDRVAYPFAAEQWALRTDLTNEDMWLFGHELGHHFQTSDWKGNDITEVTVNLFTLYTLSTYLNGGGEFDTAMPSVPFFFGIPQLDNTMLRTYRWDDARLFERLDMYRQLVEQFGWGTYKQVFASYYSDEYPRSEFGDYLDGFAIRFSAISGYDLANFFEHWEYPMSQEAADTIRSAGSPEWMPEGW